jgi:Flp pilus assembly protein TadD
MRAPGLPCGKLRRATCLRPPLPLLLLMILLPLAAANAQSPTLEAGRARLLFDQKKYAEAAVILEKAGRTGKQTPADLILLGMCYTELQALDKAGAALDMAALMEPGSVPLLNARGNLAFARKRFGDALAYFREAHRLDPGDRNALTGMVASLANAGVEMFGQGRTEDARKSFLEALELDPQSVPALRNMGIVELEKGDPAVSAQYFERALAVSPESVELLKLLFLARNRQGDTAAMLPVLDRLTAAQPADPEPHAVKGRLLEAQGKQDEAEAEFRKAVERGSQDPLPYLRAGAARRDRFMLHDAVAKSVQLIASFEIQASQAIGKAGKAEDLRGAKLLTTKVEEVRATLASSLSLLREIDGDAVFQEDLSRLQSWYPGSVDLSAALGRLFREKEQWDRSLAAWQRILRDRPLDREAQEGEGLALEKLGQKDLAIMAYRRALELDPKSADLYAALRRLYAGREAELRQILLDRSYRDTRNAQLFRELAGLESALGLEAEAAVHSARVVQIESGK